MYKHILFFVFVLVSSTAFSQYTPMTAFGYQMKRVSVDSTLHIPSFCGVPTLRNSQLKNGALAMDTCNNTLYKYTNANGWSAISGGGGSGTVTSVATGYGLTGGPITTTGTISADTATLSGKYVRISDTSGMLAPYLNGADTVSISNRINEKFNTSDTSNKWVNSVTSLNDSTIRVVKGATTTDIIIRSSATVTAATRLVTTVYNNSGSTITKGSVIYINGRHSSNLPTIALAQANTEQNSYATFALVENDILNNNSGTVIQAGNITNLNLPTANFTDGDVIYLSPTTAGGITRNKSTVLAPNHIVKIGTVTRAHPTFGSIEIKIENGWQLDELSDVSIPTVPFDSVLLQFSRVDSLWHDVSVSNVIGNRYIKPSDTSVFQRKNVAAYTFKANNTNAAANATDQVFRDPGVQTYTGTITWTGTTAPSGTTNHSYNWQRIGNQVTLNITLNYGTAGNGLTAVNMALPADCPAPKEQSGLGAANDILYFATGQMTTATNTSNSNLNRAALRVNGADTGYEVFVSTSSGAYRFVNITVQYFVN